MTNCNWFQALIYSYKYQVCMKNTTYKSCTFRHQVGMSTIYRYIDIFATIYRYFCPIYFFRYIAYIDTKISISNHPIYCLWPPQKHAETSKKRRNFFWGGGGHLPAPIPVPPDPSPRNSWKAFLTRFWGGMSNWSDISIYRYFSLDISIYYIGPFWYIERRYIVCFIRYDIPSSGVREQVPKVEINYLRWNCFAPRCLHGGFGQVWWSTLINITTVKAFIFTIGVYSIALKK